MPTRSNPLPLFLLCSFSLLAPACTLGGGDGDDDDGGPVVGGPEEGSWFYSEGNVADGCSFTEEVSNGGGNFEITNSSGSGFHVIPNDGTPEFDCSLDGNDFTCDNRLVDSLDEQGVTIEVNVVATGRLSSKTAIVSGIQDATVTCEGSNCDLAASLLTNGGSFPCDIAVDFEADLN